MALASTNNERYVTVGSATTSDHITLTPRQGGGSYILSCTSAGAFALDIQVSNDAGVNFVDAYMDATTKATINTATPTAQHFIVPAGSYRMDVDTYNSTITMRAIET